MSLELILEFLQLFLWFIIIPFAIGWIPCTFLQDRIRTGGMIMAAGYLTMFAVFEAAVFPMVLLKLTFTTAVRSITVIFILAAAAGIVLSLREGITEEGILQKILRSVGISAHSAEEDAREQWKVDIQSICLWGLFLILVGFQLYQAVTLAVFDGDDAYYVAQSVTAVNRDSMYGYIPYNGFGTSLDIRHAIAVLPLWIAFVAKMSGIHATILSHLILPFVFVPLTYLAYYLVAKRLFTEKRRLIPAFLIVIGMLQFYGNVSIYTKETFFVMRTWQGKSFFANFVLVITLAIILWLFEEGKDGERKNPGLWAMLFCANITAAFSTALGVFLMAILIGITGGCLAVRNRSVRLLWKFVVACCPCVVFTLLYVVMK
ncbi:MAG: hypothetical protein K2K54_01060 [Lachnospiraceae bacterium]|nr:hypothetical protein [Lachnospiraceae bacterium]